MTDSLEVSLGHDLDDDGTGKLGEDAPINLIQSRYIAMNDVRNLTNFGLLSLLDNEAIELEFISVLIYYTYKRKQKRRESMMCRNDKSRVGPKWKTQQFCWRKQCE